MAMKYDPETGELISDYEYELRYPSANRIGATEAIGMAKDVSDIAKNIGDEKTKQAGKDLAEEAADWAPAMTGAGLVAKTISGAIDLQNQQEMAKYLNEVAKYNAKQNIVDRGVRVAQGIRV